MAAVQLRGDSFRVLFRYHGRQESFTVGKVSEEEAQAKASQVEYLLLRLKQRLATLPPGVDIVDYVQFDGNPPAALITSSTNLVEGRRQLTLAVLRDRYVASHEASLEKSTVTGIRVHFKHLTRKLGKLFPIADLSLSHLQGYVDHRAKAKGTNGRKLSAATIKKEIISLRTAWNWGVKMKLVAGRFPYDGLRYPRTTEKPPFQTREEIERQIAAGGLSQSEVAELWQALYLTVDEVPDVLKHVHKNARHGFIYPMFCLAIHTGARRSEMVRLRIADVDLAGKSVLISERKRVKGRSTSRRVPLAPTLVEALKSWLAEHPGGPWLFCQPAEIGHSRKRTRKQSRRRQQMSPASGSQLQPQVATRKERRILPLTPDEATDHFKRTLAKSKWKVIRGWHCFRHSFISALASASVDQRLIDEFVGHQSEEQRRRYRHLYPGVKEQAITQVFS